MKTTNAQHASLFGLQDMTLKSRDHMVNGHLPHRLLLFAERLVATQASQDLLKSLKLQKSFFKKA